MVYFALLLTVIGSLGFIANMVQLILTHQDESLRNTVFRITLLSLNVADIFSSVIICFIAATDYLVLYSVIDLAFFEQIRQAYFAAITFSQASSFTHVAFIAIQRVTAVIFPFKVKQIISKSRCYSILALTWIISIALAIFVYFDKNLGQKVLASIGLSIGFALIAIYTLVCYKTMQQSIVNNISGDIQAIRRQSDRRVLKYSVAITVVFVICTYPASLNEFIAYPRFLHIASDFLYVINPLLDTLLYFMSSYCRRKRERDGSSSTVVVNMRVRNNWVVNATTSDD